MEFDENMDPTQLYAYLCSKQIPEKDCQIIKGKAYIKGYPDFLIF